jgi:hypothetical protein
MQAACIGVGSADPAVIDKHDLFARLSKEASHTTANNSATDDDDLTIQLHHD